MGQSLQIEYKNPRFFKLSESRILKRCSSTRRSSSSNFSIHPDRKWNARSTYQTARVTLCCSVGLGLNEACPKPKRWWTYTNWYFDDLNRFVPTSNSSTTTTTKNTPKIRGEGRGTQRERIWSKSGKPWKSLSCGLRSWSRISPGLLLCNFWCLGVRG